VKVLVEDLAVDTSELCSRKGLCSSVQVLSEPNHPPVDLLEGCGFSPRQGKNPKSFKGISFQLYSLHGLNCTY